MIATLIPFAYYPGSSVPNCSPPLPQHESAIMKTLFIFAFKFNVGIPTSVDKADFDEDRQKRNSCKKNAEQETKTLVISF